MLLVVLWNSWHGCNNMTLKLFAAQVFSSRFQRYTSEPLRFHGIALDPLRGATPLIPTIGCVQDQTSSYEWRLTPHDSYSSITLNPLSSSVNPNYLNCLMTLKSPILNATTLKFQCNFLCDTMKGFPGTMEKMQT